MSTPLQNPRVRRALFPDPPRKKARTPSKLTIARSVRGLAETKYSTIEGPWLATATQGVRISPSQLIQGNNISNRDGLKVHATRLTGMLVSDGTGPFRVIVYCPKDPDAEIDAALGYSSVNPADFWVLHDQNYYTTDSSSYAHINLPLNHNIQWGSGTATAWRRNPLKIYLYKARTTGAIAGHFRMFFKDV